MPPLLPQPPHSTKFITNLEKTHPFCPLWNILSFCLHRRQTKYLLHYVKSKLRMYLSKSLWAAADQNGTCRPQG